MDGAFLQRAELRAGKRSLRVSLQRMILFGMLCGGVQPTALWDAAETLSVSNSEEAGTSWSNKLTHRPSREGKRGELTNHRRFDSGY